jgi:hypothetical protein
MTQPQDPARRKKQKRRRETQLAKWRASHPVPSEGANAKDEPKDAGARAAQKAG